MKITKSILCYKDYKFFKNIIRYTSTGINKFSVHVLFKK